jgi:hypothetical protein
MRPFNQRILVGKLQSALRCAALRCAALHFSQRKLKLGLAEY